MLPAVGSRSSAEKNDAWERLFAADIIFADFFFTAFCAGKKGISGLYPEIISSYTIIRSPAR